MAIREGLWDCTYCGSTNQGRGMNCSSCGRRRDPDVKFYLPEDAAEVTDQAALDRAALGADWSCSFCGTDNPANADECSQCHATRGDSVARKTSIIPDASASEVSAAGSAGAPNNSTGGPAPAPSGKGRTIGIIAGVVVLIVAGIIGFIATRTSEEILTVQRAEWQRSIEIEETYMAVREARAGQVPSGARELSRKTVQDGTEKVQIGTEKVKTGTRDLGNGYFEDVYEDRPVYEERPVYVEMVTYEIADWRVARAVESSGLWNDAPQWPAFSLRSGEREGARGEVVTVELSGEDKDYQYHPEIHELASFEPGSRWTAIIGGFGGIRSLEAVR